jgi:excisionase family DNA binding protein
MNETSEDFLTAEQLSQVTPLTKDQVYRRARQGVIPCYRFGKTVFFRLEEVLDAAHVPATQAPVVVEEGDEGRVEQETVNQCEGGQDD